MYLQILDEANIKYIADELGFTDIEAINFSLYFLANAIVNAYEASGKVQFDTDIIINVARDYRKKIRKL